MFFLIFSPHKPLPHPRSRILIFSCFWSEQNWAIFCAKIDGESYSKADKTSSKSAAKTSNNFSTYWTGTKKLVHYDKHIDSISISKFVSTFLEDISKFKRLKEFNKIKFKDYENE